MATWHQRQNPVKLWHTEKFTVVSEPPGGCLSVARYDTLEDASAHLASLRERGDEHNYILYPARKD